LELPIAKSAMTNLTTPKIENPGSSISSLKSFNVQNFIKVEEQNNLDQLTEFRIDSSELLSSDKTGPIATGAYGSVFVKYYVSQKVAFKEFKSDLKINSRDIFEAEILFKLRHPNVIILYGAVIEPGVFGIVMQYIKGGSLYHHLHKFNNKLTSDEIESISKKLLME